MYLITELLLGGELLDAVLARGSYNEADARSCAVQLLRGIEYLHSRCAGMFLLGLWAGFLDPRSCRAAWSACSISMLLNLLRTRSSTCSPLHFVPLHFFVGSCFAGWPACTLCKQGASREAQWEVLLLSTHTCTIIWTHAAASFAELAHSLYKRCRDVQLQPAPMCLFMGIIAKQLCMH